MEPLPLTSRTDFRTVPHEPWNRFHGQGNDGEHGHDQRRSDARRRGGRHGVPGAQREPTGQRVDTRQGARDDRRARLPAEPAGAGPLPGTLPDARRRRPVLHPRLGGRATPRSVRRTRRQPLRPRPVRRRATRPPRRVPRHPHPPRPRRRADHHVDAAAARRPAAHPRRRGARRPDRRRRRRRARSSAPTTSKVAASRPGTSSRSVTGASRSSATHPDNPLGFVSSTERERGYREMLAAAGLGVDEQPRAPRCPRPRGRPPAHQRAARPARPTDRGVRRVRRPGPGRDRGGPDARAATCRSTCP